MTRSEKKILRKNVWKYVTPTVLSMVSFFFFSVMDGIFVGQGVGTDALGAINLAMPFIMTISALFMLFSIGGVTIFAIRLGRGDTKGANQAFMNAVLGMLLVGAVLEILGVFFTKQLCFILGASGDIYYQMVHDYIFWYSVFVITDGLCTILSAFARNDGSPSLVSVSMIVGTTFNIFGDWLMVFPLHMGVSGAAIATGVSQSLSLAIVLTHYLRKKGIIRFVKTKIDLLLWKKIMKRGLPEMISQLAPSIMTICMNYVLLNKLNNVAVNAFSIINYVATFSVAIFAGTSEGLQPLFGQCFGSKDRESLAYYLKAGMKICLTGSVVINVLLIFISGPICTLFNADSETYNMTLSAIPKYDWGFIMISLSTIISAFFYSTKHTREALILNISRTFVFNTICILLLPSIFGTGIVWYTNGIGETLALITAFVLLYRAVKKENYMERK
jgi:putative MATE family efflux protein